MVAAAVARAQKKVVAVAAEVGKEAMRSPEKRKDPKRAKKGQAKRAEYKRFTPMNHRNS